MYILCLTDNGIPFTSSGSTGGRGRGGGDAKTIISPNTLFGDITRLLGRPQPQMYPPVALNQYILVNRTRKHYIYASRPHKHLKITPKLNNM